MARIHRTRIADDAEGTHAGGAVGVHLRFERGDIDCELIRHGNQAETRETESEKTRRLVLRVVCLGGAVDHGARRRRLQAAGVDVESDSRIACDRQPHQVGHRAARQQHAARLCGKAEDFLAPVDDLSLHVRR